MALYLSRRDFMLGGAAALTAATLPSISIPRAMAAVGPVQWASLTPGFTVLLTEYIRHHKLDQKNGFTLSPPVVYTSVPTYYGDFVAGNYDVCIGSWDSFAVRYLGGVPIQLLCTVTTGEMIAIMASKKSGITSIADLKGKVIAAPQSTGTYRITRAVLQEYEKFDLEGDMTVQNVTNPAASVSILRAGSADTALTWEPNITSGMAEDASLGVVFNVGQTYTAKTGQPLPYFGVAVRNELLQRDKDIARKINGVFKDCIAGILGDVDAAVAVVGERTGFKPEVLKEAISSGRLSFVFDSMFDEKARNSIKAAAEFFARNKLLDKLPDDGFLIQS